MRREPAALLLIAVILSGAGAAAGPAWAQPAEAGVPTISLATTDLRPGERVVVSLTGWRSRNVTLSVCGNRAARGAADCNLISSQSLKLVSTPGPTLTELVVATPPGTCPCVIRGSSATQDEVASTPIELAGVAVGPIIGAVGGELVAVSVDVRAAHRGLVAAVRSALAGPSGYRATVAVRNLTTETLPNISLVGSVGRSRTDVAASFEIPPSGPLAPGQTWEHEVRVTLPAPVLDRFLWRVIASGAGGPVEAESSTNALPIGFVVLVSVLAADLAAIAWRTPARRRRRRARSAELGVRRGSAAKVPLVAGPLVAGPLVAGPLVAGPPTGPRCGRRRRHWAIAALGVPRRHRRFARGSPSLQESPHAGRRFAAG